MSQDAHQRGTPAAQYWPSLPGPRHPVARPYWPSGAVAVPLHESPPRDGAELPAETSATSQGFVIVDVEAFERLQLAPPNLRPGFQCEVIRDSCLPPRLSVSG